MKINFTGLKNFAMRAMNRKPSAINTMQSIAKQQAQNVTKVTVEPAAKATVKETKELFCHQYWKEMKAEGVLKPSCRSSVDLHGELNGINHHFIHSPYPEHMNQVHIGAQGLTPRQMISQTDVEFKRLKPTDKPLCVFRSIGKKPDFFPEYKLYQKRCAIKQGDVIDMKEYAYATSDRSYAGIYLINNEGILYEINVPKGARVSRRGVDINDEIVFPRSSKFKCTDVKRIKDADNDYMHVKLDYIVPQEVV